MPHNSTLAGEYKNDLSLYFNTPTHHTHQYINIFHTQNIIKFTQKMSNFWGDIIPVGNNEVAVWCGATVLRITICVCFVGKFFHLGPILVLGPILCRCSKHQILFCSRNAPGPRSAKNVAKKWVLREQGDLLYLSVGWSNNNGVKEGNHNILVPTSDL